MNNLYFNNTIFFGATVSKGISTWEFFVTDLLDVFSIKNSSS